MKYLLILLFSLNAYATDYSVGAKFKNPCVWPEAVLLSTTGATSTTNATQIIGLVSGKKIYVCSLTVIGVSGSSTPTFSLITGTGSNCASTVVTAVAAFGTTADVTYRFDNPVVVSAASNALCYKQTGTSPVNNYYLTYVQQ